MAQEIADSTLLETWSSGGNIVEPDSAKIIEGWQLGEQPPHEYMNWLQNTFGSKLNHILKNGVATWNNETEYLAGSSVQNNGNVWLCKATNTNSEPTDVNANWKRIITVESLTTVLNGYVATTGDQDIDDIKTFLKSPIVPTPTTGTQAVNKDYVDNVATLNINDLDEKTTPVDTDNLALQETGGLLKKLSFANLKIWILSLFNPSITGTVSFDSTTNNIQLTNIVTSLGLEIGDVIQISGADDAKNNSEFTVEVITDNDNIIVNQAHANKDTSKNLANRSGDTGVTVKLLANRYNAPLGLGQGWVNVTANRVTNVSYTNNMGRTILVNVSSDVSTGLFVFFIDGIAVASVTESSSSNFGFTGMVVPSESTYSTNYPSITKWTELR